MQSTAEPGPRRQQSPAAPQGLSSSWSSVHELLSKAGKSPHRAAGRDGAEICTSKYWWGSRIWVSLQPHRGMGVQEWCWCCLWKAGTGSTTFTTTFSHLGCRTCSRAANPTSKHHSLFLQQNSPTFGSVSGHICVLRFDICARRVCIHNRVFVRILVFPASFPGWFYGKGEVMQRISPWMSGIQWWFSPSTPACWQFSDIK